MVGRNILEHPQINDHDIYAPSSKELNLTSYDATETYVKKVRPNFIIHAAGKVGGIQANINEPVKFFHDNLEMGKNIIMSAYNNNIRNLLNIGSSCMYPRNISSSLREDMILKGELEPTNEGYALAKIAASRLCQYINNENQNFTFKTIVPCNIFGRWDKFDPNYSHMVPAVITKIEYAKTNNKQSVTIWGDGKARREFMYAADLADCICNTITHFKSMPNIMNVGIGHDYTIDEYYRVIANVIGYTGNFIHDLDKPVGMNKKLVDVSQLTKWGWRTKTSLADGISATYNFYKEHMENT